MIIIDYINPIMMIMKQKLYERVMDCVYMDTYYSLQVQYTYCIHACFIITRS